MSRDEAITKLKEIQKTWDPERTHGEADDILCDLLRSIGYGDVVDEWDKVRKWYA